MLSVGTFPRLSEQGICLFSRLGEQGIGMFPRLGEQGIGMFPRLRMLIVGAFPPGLHFAFQSAQAQIHGCCQTYEGNQGYSQRGQGGYCRGVHPIISLFKCLIR